MDHLPEPLDPCSPVTEVPFLCGEEDFIFQCCWYHYPEQRGWLLHENGKALSYSGTEPMTVGLTSAFLQAWLYFGVLIEVFSACATATPLDLLVEDGTSGLVISTKQLPRLLDDIVESERGLSAEVRRQHHDRVWKCLELAGMFSFLLRDEEDLPVLDEVQLAILVLGETLSSAIDKIWTEIASEQSWFFRPSSWAFNRMLQHGWCRSDAYMLHHIGMGKASGCYLASRMKPPRKHPQHLTCSDKKCFTREIDEAIYQTDHVLPKCGCLFISVDGEKLSLQLIRQQIPRVSVSQDVASDTVRVKIVGRGSGPYVAISHVWSDGMGNAKQNALPSCQLLKLHRLVSALYGQEEDNDQSNIPFWIDTLCIPRVQEARKAALNLLVRTYEEADKILILDSSFADVVSEVSVEELLVRIRLCRWMQRLWTLEEGVLASRRLYLQLRDRAINLYDILTKAERSSYDPIAKEMRNTILRDLPLVQKAQIPNMLDYAVALQLRTSTREDDEALCLASLMGLDIDEIYALSTVDERMAFVFSSIGKISANILFFECPKSKTGFRWAPRSFISTDHRLSLAVSLGPDSQPMSATVDRLGLHFDHGGILLDLKWDETYNENFYFQDPVSKSWTRCTLLQTATLYEQDSDNLRQVGQSHVYSQAQGRHVLIIPDAKAFADRAALVLITREDQGVLHALYVTCCQLKRNYKGESPQPNFTVGATLMSSSTKWCIT